MFYNRREFLKFIGAGSVAASNATLLTFLSSCTTTTENIKGLSPSSDDELKLISGLSYDLLFAWGDPINKNETFGFNNDYIAFHKLNENEAILWVNHEYVIPKFLGGEERTKSNVDRERKEVGGSLVKISKASGSWKLVKGDVLNRRIDATTKIPFANNAKVMGQSVAEGTLANCAGGYTPWGTFLTCEENYDHYYGERVDGKLKNGKLLWNKHYQNPPEHYGWVVEIDPLTGDAKKLTGLGRCAHECATPIATKKGQVAVYTGDDKKFEHLYRFISKESDSLDEGTLYVASLEKGQWLSMDYAKSEILKKNFKDQMDVLVHARKAAKLLGATPLDRPEDIEVHPKTGEVYVTLTNNDERGNFHGSILKISPENGDHGALNFKSSTYLVGGKDTGISSPDNIAFDKNGNLWIATDRSGKKIEKGPYKGFGNNGLFVIPASGQQAGQIIQVASAPVDAELTGICFDEKNENLFLAVQHPGETSKDMKNLTSKWPHGNIPKSAVVAIKGPFLDTLVKG